MTLRSRRKGLLKLCHKLINKEESTKEKPLLLPGSLLARERIRYCISRASKCEKGNKVSNVVMRRSKLLLLSRARCFAMKFQIGKYRRQG